MGRATGKQTATALSGPIALLTALGASGCSLTSLDGLTSTSEGTGGGSTASNATASASASGSSSQGSVGSATSSVGSTTGSGGGGAGGAGVGGAGDGGAPPPYCGDGRIDPGEECDDADDPNQTGCEGCVVACAGEGFTKNDETFHCYHVGADSMPWANARTYCTQLGEGWTLSSIRSVQELTFAQGLVAARGHGFSWIGGSDLEEEGVYVWVNGEPWDGTPWGGDFSAEAEIHDCVEIFADTGFTTYDCEYPKPPLCEASPIGITDSTRSAP